MISEQQRSGHSATALCRERGIGVTHFLQFRRKLSEAHVTPEVIDCYDGKAIQCAEPARDCRTAPAGASNHLYGRLTMVKSSVSETRYEAYDALGRVTAHRQKTGTGDGYGFGYSYTLANGLKTETYPSGRVLTTTYLANGRVAGVTGYILSQVVRPRPIRVLREHLQKRVG